MGKKIILNYDEINRVSLEDAIRRFLRDCKLRNLSPHTLTYYQEDLDYFKKYCPVKFIDQVNQDVYEEFIVSELDKGKKVTSLNSRIRGLRVFFKFCAEREYMVGFKIKLLKENKEIKEPYTDAELARLLARPHTTTWTDYIPILKLIKRSIEPQRSCEKKPRIYWRKMFALTTRLCYPHPEIIGHLTRSWKIF